jgi:hypothetical protein
MDMWLRLRQICFVAEKLATVEEALMDIFRVKVAYREPNIKRFGLENVLFPFGNQFVEVVAPIEANTTAGRYLERRGGDGGYMFITQCDEHAPRRARVESLGIRIVEEMEKSNFLNIQLHPKDTGGTLFEINQQLGVDAQALDSSWYPAGPDWKPAQSLERVNGIAAAEIQCEDPAAVAARWSELAEIPLTDEAGNPVMSLDNAAARFVPCTDGRPEGLGGIDVVATDKAAILASASERDAVSGESQVYICGMRINLL